MRKYLHTLPNRRQRGQGIIEYAGALITAAMIVAVLTTGMADQNWMYNAYDAIFTTAGNMLTSKVNTLGQ